MTGYQAAQQVIEDVGRALEAVQIDALTTLDPAEAGAALGAGRPVVLAGPPTTTWETYHVAVHAFEVLVISTDTDPLTAWPELDALAEQLVEPLALDTSRVTTWQPAHGDPWPCLVLTLDTTTTRE